MDTQHRKSREQKDEKDAYVHALAKSKGLYGLQVEGISNHKPPRKEDELGNEEHITLPYTESVSAWILEVSFYGCILIGNFGMSTS